MDRETVWVNQRQMAELFDKGTDTRRTCTSAKVIVSLINHANM